MVNKAKSKQLSNINKENSQVAEKLKTIDEQLPQIFDNFDKQSEKQQQQYQIQQQKNQQLQNSINLKLSQHQQQHPAPSQSQQYIQILNDSSTYLKNTSINSSDFIKSFQKQPFVQSQFPNKQSQNSSNFMHQPSMSHSFTIKEPLNENTFLNTPEKYSQLHRADLQDSNGVIRGRKIDSPQLVVVRELRDQEDQEEGGFMASGKLGAISALLKSDQDTALLFNAFHSGSNEELHNIWRSSKKQRVNSETKKKRSKSKNNRAINHIQSKSQDNKKKSKSNHRLQRASKEEKLLLSKEQKSNNQQNNQQQHHHQQLLKSSLINKRMQFRNQNLQNQNNVNTNGTKSSREIKTSMGFNELLNQLDKEGSTQHDNHHHNHHHNQQQQQQIDFKNRTTHDLLKLELSGIRRQNSSGANIQQQNTLMNKSQERQKHNNKKVNSNPNKQSSSQNNNNNNNNKQQKSQEHKKTINQKKLKSNLPKSILKKNFDYVINDQIFQYAFNNNNNNNNNNITPDKNQNHQGVTTNSFLHSEHGRCTTSQGQNNNNQSSMNLQNGKSQSTNNINILFSKIKVNNKKPQNQNSNSKKRGENRNNNNSSSPERGSSTTGAVGSSGALVRDFKTIGNNGSNNIDKLVRENIRRMKSKEDEEKQQKIISEDQRKKKKAIQEHKNELVRKINKEKTYKKANNNQYLQQSQDLHQQQNDAQQKNSNKLILDQKFLQLSKNINSNREKIIQKQSQSQKIDFQKIKENSKVKNLKIKNHRKSYGLEFIDIKKEIQDELRTIDLKFKNNLYDNKILEESSSMIAAADTEDFPHQQMKAFPLRRLKVKSQKKIQQQCKDDTMPFNAGGTSATDQQFISERIQPINKIIVVKKNKIRKFMKMKKKNLIIQKIKEQKEEIIKTIKMQENISKLNDFCKKKLEKQQQQKKKNTTLQDDFHQQHIHTVTDKNDISKISGRRIVFDNIVNNPNNRTINHNQEDNHDNFHNHKEDSSRLSTEFYEEYFRLINSIKKEQQLQKQENLSRMNLSSNQNLTSQSCNNLFKSPGMNKSQSPQRKISNTQIINLSPKSKEKISNKQVKSKSITRSGNGGAQEKTKHQNSKATVNKIPQSKSNQRFQEKLQINSRAESAPLLINIQNSFKKKQKHSPSQQKEKKQIKKTKKQEIIKVPSEPNQGQMILEKIIQIQRNYRMHLLQKGFYNLQTDEDQYLPDQNHSIQTVQENNESSSQFETQIYDGNKLDSLNEQLNQQDLDDHYDLHIEQENHEYNHKDQIINYEQEEEEDYEDDEDHEDEEDDEEDEEEEHDNIIIINQQSNDDKKVVYMSNINSCSLPQTPKIDDQAASQKQDQSSINNLRKVFDYKPGIILEQSQFFSQDLLDQDPLHQSISQKPSIDSQIDHSLNDKKEQNTDDQHHYYQILQQKPQQDLEELKKADYSLRLFTGSESLLRELKLSTPKQQHQSSSSHRKYDLMSNNDDQNLKSSISKSNSHYSVKSQQRIPQSNIGAESYSNSKTNLINTHINNDQNSHSSQSLFERNSFQQFTMSKIQQIMKNNEYMNLIEMREKALQYRQVKEKKFIKKMLKNKQLSPRTYISKKEQLEKWVKLEKDEIQKTKQQFQEEWQKTLQMIEDTQRNVDNMREKMKMQIDNNNNNHKISSSQFNSHSSRNSSSSFATVSKQDNLQRKSILDQEEFQPISQRSLIMSLGAQPLSAKEQNKNKASTEKNHQLSFNKSKEDKKVSKEQKEQSNLIDFLEQSWIKSQQKENKQDFNSNPSQIKQQPSLSKQKLTDNILLSDLKMFKDLKSKNQQIEQQQQQKGISYLEHYASESDELSQRQNNVQDNKIISNNNIINNEERPLTRSRSEQDLSDLIKKSKLNFNEIDLYNLEEDSGKEGVDTYRLGESQQQQMHNLKDDNNNNNNKNNHDEIKIQENMFDDSSNRYSKGKNYYRDNENEEDENYESNDSLLNESELNNYFQDQKFSIEDFKSLDKRKIMSHHNIDEDEELLERNQSEIFINQPEESIDDQDKNINFQQKSQINEQNDLNEPEPTFSDSKKMFENRQLSPELQPKNFIQQNLLFQNTRPGQNIKISDILKQTQSLQEHNSSSNFLYNQDTSQLLFQNQQINQSVAIPSLQPLMQHQHEKLADSITDEIINYLLQNEIQVPKRELNSQLQQIPEQQQQDIQSSDQVAVGDVFIIDSQQNEKEQRRELIDYRLRVLIESDLIRVENYINEVIQALQQAELSYLTQLAQNPHSAFLDQQSNYHKQFLQILTTPIQRNQLDILNQLQTSEIGSYDHFETTLDPTANPILPIDLYLDIERQREENQIRMMNLTGFNDVDLENSVLQESVHIHNKSIFDALNESLMKFRPYGIQGEPMPWSNKNRRLQTKVDTNSVDTERLFFMVKQDVLRWVQSCCGNQPSPIFLCKRDIHNNEQFDDEIFQETRERRLAQMLASEVVENEHQWLNYDFEEAQVKIDLSDMILEHLVEETALFLNFKYQMSIEND